METLACDARRRTKRSQVAPSCRPRRRAVRPIGHSVYPPMVLRGGRGRRRIWAEQIPGLARPRPQGARPRHSTQTGQDSSARSPSPVRACRSRTRTPVLQSRAARHCGADTWVARHRCARWSPSDDRRTRRVADETRTRLVVPRRLLQHTRRVAQFGLPLVVPRMSRRGVSGIIAVSHAIGRGRRMKEIHGTATARLEVPAEKVFELITDVDRLPDWNAAIEAVEQRPAALCDGAEWTGGHASSAACLDGGASRRRG